MTVNVNNKEEEGVKGELGTSMEITDSFYGEEAWGLLEKEKKKREEEQNVRRKTKASYENQRGNTGPAGRQADKQKEWQAGKEAKRANDWMMCGQGRRVPMAVNQTMWLVKGVEVGRTRVRVNVRLMHATAYCRETKWR